MYIYIYIYMYMYIYSQISHYSLTVVFHILNNIAARLMYIRPQKVSFATIGYKTQLSRPRAFSIVS